MTKYILHGGNTSSKADDNKKYFYEIAGGLSEDATILCVYFSRPKEEWQKLFEEDKNNLFSATLKKNKYIIADDKTDVFIKQLKNADAILLRGGKTEKLIEALNKVDSLDKLIQNKIISGSSAGAYALSKYFYSNDKDKILSGLGILPIKTICHYNDKMAEKLEKLKNFGEELEIYKIPEEKFFVIER